MATGKQTKLTKMQSAFCLALVEGKTQYQAYIDAGYNVDGKSRGYIDCEASKLADNPKIIQRKKELEDAINAERLKKIAWDRDKAAEKLLWLIDRASEDIEENGISTANVKAVGSSIRELNRIEGIIAIDKARIRKIDAEVDNLNGVVETTEDDGFVDALNAVASEVWSDSNED